MSEQRLIDANYLLNRLRGNVLIDVTPEIEYEIEKTPTINPVRHGEWLNDSGYDDWHCSECGFEINCDEDYPTKYDNFKYCGRCGAKMDKE